MAVTASPGMPLAPQTPQALNTFNVSTNQIQTPNTTYDASGNLTNDGHGGSYTAYDAENYLTSCTVNGVSSSYDYDGNERRVIKKVGSASPTIFVYVIGGKLVAEYSGPTSSSNAGTSYLTTDHLGSTRIVTRSDQSVVARHDYLPFGTEIQAGFGGRTPGQGYNATDDTRQKFTSKERDSESALDCFGARYYSPNQGRFLSVDPMITGRTSNPQALNHYAYSLDDPMNRVDPDGQRDLPTQVASYIKTNLAAVLQTAIKLNISAAAIFATGGWESGWGTSRAYRQFNNSFGLSGGSGKPNYHFASLSEGFDFWAKNLREKFPHVLGLHDGNAVVDGLVSGQSGFKYNTDPRYAPDLKGMIDSSAKYTFGLDFFDNEVLNQLEHIGLYGVPFKGIYIYHKEDFIQILSRPENDPTRQALLSGIYDEYIEYVHQIGTDRDPNVQKIRSSFLLPGSNAGEEEYALYVYRVNQAFGR